MKKKDVLTDKEVTQIAGRAEEYWEFNPMIKEAFEETLRQIVVDTYFDGYMAGLERKHKIVKKK